MPASWVGADCERRSGRGAERIDGEWGARPTRESGRGPMARDGCDNHHGAVAQRRRADARGET
jgi:hypothetical protein